MNKLSPFPFIPTAQPNESPLSFLRRTAIGNGYSNLLALLHSLLPNIDHSLGMLGYVARSPLVFKSLCNSMGIPESSIKQVIYRRAGNGREDNIIWQGLEVKLGDLQFNTEKICIPCYLEKSYTLTDWDHFAALGCPRHQVFLDACCPVCGMPWYYKHEPLTCGCDTASVLANVLPIRKNRAELLPAIVNSKRQDRILILSNIRQLFDWWLQLGVNLSQAEQSEYLYDLMHGNWPALETNKEKTIHSRIIFLPFLSSSDDITKLLLDKLLKHSTCSVRSLDIATAFVSKNQTRLLLGISRARLNNFIRENLLCSNNDGKFSLEQINQLLLTSKWLPFSHEKEMLWKQSCTTAPHPSLATMIKSESLNTSALPSESSIKNGKPLLTLKDAANILQANAESIRHLIKIGLLKAVKGTKKSGVQWSIKPNDLNSFNQQYVFASAIARKINLPVTTTSSRLRSLGIIPVGGPCIDDGKTYLFSRSDLVSIHDDTLNQPYKSPAGRKRRNAPVSVGTISSRQLANKLHIAPYQIRFIIREGWIDGIKNSQGHYLFDPSRADRLVQTINDDYVDIVYASELLKQSPQSFRRTWIISEFLSEYILGSRRLITRSDLERIQQVWKTNKTSAYIGRQIGRHRSFCINLEKMGLLKPTLIIGSKAKKIKLYPDIHPLYQYYKIQSGTFTNSHF